jgi:hypothetical protein
MSMSRRRRERVCRAEHARGRLPDAPSPCEVCQEDTRNLVNKGRQGGAECSRPGPDPAIDHASPGGSVLPTSPEFRKDKAGWLALFAQIGEVQKVGFSHLFLARRSGPCWPSPAWPLVPGVDRVRSTGPPPQGGLLRDAGLIRTGLHDDEDGWANQRPGGRG